MIEIREHVPLAPFTTLGVGGPARYFCDVASSEDLVDAVAFARKRALTFFIVGRSSNTLISDDGFPGLVIRVHMMGFEWSDDGDAVHLRLGAGEEWDACVAKAVEQGWSGIECLSGIPGSIGAAPVQNIGAYGHSIEEVLERVEVLDTSDGIMKTLSRDECNLSYRSSIFKTAEGKRYIVAYVHIRLHRATTAQVPRYHDLQEAFARMTGDVPITDIRKAVLAVRAAKGMVLMEGVERYKSAGSFFKNPVVSQAQVADIEKKLTSHPDGLCADPWFWVQKNSDVKVAAACLIERSGFSKGCRDGAVGISPRHSLSLINLGGATAADVVALAEKIQTAVHERFGVTLEREVEYIGF